MGSKRRMLANGLGKILLRETRHAKRFADLFSGSAAVSWYVAENTPCKVLSCDLQEFAVVLAESIIGREDMLEWEHIWKLWHERADYTLQANPSLRKASRFDGLTWERARRKHVAEAREMCQSDGGPLVRAYGGYYFSPKQAMALDALRLTLPTEPAEWTVALAALIFTASECAASPGHTAQPFQPTEKGARFLFEAWRRDIYCHAKLALERICSRYAQSRGKGMVCDAESLAERLSDGDLAFIDPPYSGVHYSRFYHVLETLTRGTCGGVSGAGRYPAPIERPKSQFSVRSQSRDALEGLFAKLSKRGVRAVVTFPEEETSNGLSGSIVENLAREHFRCRKTVVNGRFSTLGGNKENRKARIPAYEIILELAPRE